MRTLWGVWQLYQKQNNTQVAFNKLFQMNLVYTLDNVWHIFPHVAHDVIDILKNFNIN